MGFKLNWVVWLKGLLGSEPNDIPPNRDDDSEPPPPGMEEGFVPKDQVPSPQDEDIPPVMKMPLKMECERHHHRLSEL